RQDGITDVMARLQARAATVSGIDLHMQAAQDLTVEDRVSRTQYQFSLEHPDQAEIDRWGGRLLDRLQRTPILRDVATDQHSGGRRTDVAIDRDTAARMGITTQAVDDALDTAFGQ